MIYMPPGWMHSVRNQEACVKVAWDFFEAEDLYIYVQVAKKIFGAELVVKPADYSGLAQVLKEILLYRP